MTGARLRALEMYRIIQSLKNGEEDRRREIENEQYNRQFSERQFEATEKRYEAEQAEQAEARTYARKKDAFEETLKMTGAGAGAYSDLGDFFFSKERGPAVESPAGQGIYRLPSYEQKQEADERARRAAKPLVRLTPEIARMLGKDQATEDEINALKKQYEIANPDLHLVTNTDDDGNVTVTAVDKKSFKQVGQMGLGRVGKSRTAADSESGVPDKALKAVGNLQAMIDESDGSDFKKIINQGKLLQSAYPGLVEFGIGNGGWPYVKILERASNGQLKVGEVRSIKGRRMRITRIYPNGKFDAEPVE